MWNWQITQAMMTDKDWLGFFGFVAQTNEIVSNSMFFNALLLHISRCQMSPWFFVFKILFGFGEYIYNFYVSFEAVLYHPHFALYSMYKVLIQIEI